MTTPFRPTGVHHSAHARQEPATGSVTAPARCATRAPALNDTAREERSRRVAVAAAARVRQAPSRASDLDSLAAVLALVRRDLDVMEARRRAA